MKALELAKDQFIKAEMIDGQDVSFYVFDEEQFAILWSQLCKEQREICSEQVKDKWIKNAVKTASEPELK